MDVKDKIVTLLQPIPSIDGTSKDVNVHHNIGILQRQMNQYTRAKKKAPVTYNNFSNDTSYDPEQMNILITEEINRIPAKNRWRSLGKSYQWELICKYFEDQEQYESNLVPSIKDKLKHALQNGIDIKVNYDTVNNKIQKITC